MISPTLQCGIGFPLHKHYLLTLILGYRCCQNLQFDLHRARRDQTDETQKNYRKRAGRLRHKAQ